MVKILELVYHNVDIAFKTRNLNIMKQEVVNIAALMAEKVVGSSMNVKIQDALIDETLKEMGESTWQS